MADSDTQFAIVIISLTLLSLVVMYATLSISAVKSSKKILGSNNALTLSKLFYTCILILCLMRILGWAALALEIWIYQDLIIEFNTFINKLLLTIRFIPETFFLIGFVILLWNVLVLYHVCHMRVDRQLRDVSLPPLQTLGKSVLIVIIIIVCAAQALFAVIYGFFDVWKAAEYIRSNAFLNVCSPSVLILLEIYFHCKFSGVPYKSSSSRNRLFRVNLILIFWGICRGVTGGLEFFAEEKEQQIFVAILGDKMSGTLLEKLLGPIIFVSQLFLLEVLPLLLMTDTKTTENFFIKKEIEEGLITEIRGVTDSLIEPSDTESQPSLQNTNTSYVVSDSARPSNTLKWINSEENVVIEKKEIAKKSDGKLGELYKASYGKEELFARVISYDKITTYVAEQMKEDMKKLMKVESPFLLKIRGYYHDDYSITILYEKAENFTLSSLLHSKESTKPTKPALPVKLKGNIAMQTAAAIQALHSHNPPFVHGHLSSSNVVLDKGFNAKLTDFGMPSLKKYASVKIGYSIMDASIAPEYLADRPKYINITDPSADIYAFGFLLWELFSEDQPFDNVSLKELHNLVVTQKSRPKIPNAFNELLANLIRACWQSDPKNRPTIDRVIDLLNEIDGRFSE